MKIIQAPDQILSQAAKPVEKVDKTIKKLLKDMEQTLISQTDPEGEALPRRKSDNHCKYL